MAKKEKKLVKKKVSMFNLVGKAIVNDYTYTIDANSNSSDWVYNRMNLNVNCGESGKVSTEAMGGYGSKRDNVIYVNGVKTNDDGKTVDDYSNSFTIDWEDRLDESLFDEIARNSFITVGLEVDSDGKTFYKKFLSEYDAINYAQEHLESDMVLNIRGNLQYSVYNEYTQVRKQFTSIVLSKAKEEDFRATFSQTLLVDKDSIGDYDGDENAVSMTCYIPEYVSSFVTSDGEKVKVPKENKDKRNVVFSKAFLYDCGDKEPAKIEKFLKKYLKPKKENIHAIVFDGFITKGGSLQEVTLDDLPEDIRDLVEMGAYTEEEAIEKAVGSGGKVEKYIIKAPRIIKARKEGESPRLNINEDEYTTDDLYFFSNLVSDFSSDSDDEVPFDTEDKDSEDDIDIDDFDIDSLIDDDEE